MFDDLHEYERQNSIGQMGQRPIIPDTHNVGTFTGFGSALADALPHAALTAGSAWSALLDAYGKASAYANAGTVAAVNGRPSPDVEQLKRETIDQMGDSDISRDFREKAKKFAPDPAAVGMAGQIAHGLVSSVGKAIAYTATTGPAAPLVFGGDMGINRAQELSDQGVDAGTAATAGLVTGVVSAAGLKLPPALGATRLQSALIGAGINPAMGIAERGTIHALLDHADYPTIAAQYKPFDPTQMAIEAAAGAAFGGIFHSAKAREGATLTPEEHAAALTMNEVRTRDADTLTRPGDVAAINAAHDAQLMARGQLDSGEPVSVAHGVDVDPTQVEEKITDLRGKSFDSMHEAYDDAADMLAMHLEEMGFDVRRESSRVSMSEYVHAKTPGYRYNEDTGEVLNGRELKFRLSNHTLPNAYEHAHFDVSVFHNDKFRPDTGGDIAEALRWATKTAGIEPIGDAKSLIDARIADEQAVAKAESDRKAAIADMHQSNLNLAYDFIFRQPEGTIIGVSRKGKMTATLDGKIIDTLNSFPRDWTSGTQAANGKAPKMAKADALSFLEGKVAPTSDSSKLGLRALNDVKMQERSEVRADESGSPKEPAQSESEAGSRNHDTAQTSELQAATDMLSRNPDMVVRMDDGTDVRAADLLHEADTLAEQSTKEAQGFRAAINCALRYQ